MEQLFISAPIRACQLTDSEKKLLAYICQRAAASSGQCTDTNKDFASALGIHTRTISRSINQLSESKLLRTSISKGLANQRTLIPLDTLLADYSQMSMVKPSDQRLSIDKPSTNQHLSIDRPSDYRHLSIDNPSDYRHSDSNPSSIEDHPDLDQLRLCVVTGLDIRQQPGKEHFANRQTLLRLYHAEPTVFGQLAAQLLSPSDLILLASDADACCLRLAARVRRLASLRLEAAAHEFTPLRLCPLSGADITHQGRNYPFVTEETLQTLLKLDRPAFAQILARLGLPDQPEQPLTTQWQRVLDRVQQLAQTYLPADPIPSIDEVSSAPVGARRYCPITGIDVSHQQPRHRFATAWTIETLFKRSRSGFNRVADRLLPDSLRQGNAAAQCFALSSRVRRLARAYQ